MPYSKKTYENQSRIRGKKSKRDKIIDAQLDSLAESSVIADGYGDIKNLKVDDEPLNIQINNGKVLYSPSNNTDGIPQEDNELVNKLYVDDAVASAGGGASALNDLSDVTYSSGDLTISSLDKIVTSGSLEIDSGSNIELNADGGNITFKDNTTELLKVQAEGIRFPDQHGILFNEDDVDKIYGDGDDIVISKDDTDLIYIKDDQIESALPLKVKESASAVADTAAFGQIWVKNDTPNNLYFTNDAGNDVQITNGSSLASGGGGSTTLKAYMDWYYISANLASTNSFYAATHHDEFGVSNAINTGISSYTDTEHSDIWRVARYAKRIPYNATITKVMTHVESTGASADSDIEVGVWIASFSSLSLNQQFPSTENIAIDNLAKIDFDFDTATRLMFSETTSFNATSLTQGDWMFITLRRTTGTDGSSFNCHTTVTMDIS